jgi:hypothetical protein
MGYILPNITKMMGVKSPKIFIETGTYLGGSPQLIMDNHKDLFYDKLFTIELGEDQARTAAYRYSLYEKNNFDNSKFDKHTKEKVESVQTYNYFFNKKLTLINGDSAKYLEIVLEEVSEPALIWLDAHAGAQKYARGPEDVPLLKELEAIKNHPIKEHIIAIDDAHLFGKKQMINGEVACDYSHVPYSVVDAKLKEINPNYTTGLSSPYGHEMYVAFLK